MSNFFWVFISSVSIAVLFSHLYCHGDSEAQTLSIASTHVENVTAAPAGELLSHIITTNNAADHMK